MNSTCCAPHIRLVSHRFCAPQTDSPGIQCSPTPQTIVPDYVIYPYILLAVCTSFTLFYFCFGSKESELLSVDSLGYKYNVSAKKSQFIYSNSGFCFKGNTVLPH